MPLANLSIHLHLISKLLQFINIDTIVVNRWQHLLSFQIWPNCFLQFLIDFETHPLTFMLRSHVNSQSAASAIYPFRNCLVMSTNFCSSAGLQHFLFFANWNQLEANCSCAYTWTHLAVRLTCLWNIDIWTSERFLHVGNWTTICRVKVSDKFLGYLHISSVPHSHLSSIVCHCNLVFILKKRSIDICLNILTQIWWRFVMLKIFSFICRIQQ